MEVQNISGTDLVVSNFSADRPQPVERQKSQPAEEKRRPPEENKGTKIDTLA